MADNDLDVPEELEPVDEGDVESSMLNLVDTWDSSRDPFDEWVESVSRAYYESGYGIEAAAKLLDTTPGEFGAVLSLATLDEEAIERLADDVPPKSTWYAFADASVEEIQAGLDALDEMGDEESPHAVVKSAIREFRGPTPEEKVAELPGDVFLHMSTKAKQYELLSGKARGFLYDIGQLVKAGNDLSQKQADWACDLLNELADNGAVSRDSPDDDQEICDQVLDALDR